MAVLVNALLLPLVGHSPIWRAWLQSCIPLKQWDSPLFLFLAPTPRTLISLPFHQSMRDALLQHWHFQSCSPLPTLVFQETLLPLSAFEQNDDAVDPVSDGWGAVHSCVSGNGPFSLFWMAFSRTS